MPNLQRRQTFIVSERTRALNCNQGKRERARPDLSTSDRTKYLFVGSTCDSGSCRSTISGRGNGCGSCCSHQPVIVAAVAVIVVAGGADVYSISSNSSGSFAVVEVAAAIVVEVAVAVVAFLPVTSRTMDMHPIRVHTLVSLPIWKSNERAVDFLLYLVFLFHTL